MVRTLFFLQSYDIKEHETFAGGYHDNEKPAEIFGKIKLN